MRDAREQVEVRGVQAGRGIAHAVAHRENHPANRAAGGLAAHEPLPEDVLVQGARCPESLLEHAERRREKARLPEQPLRTPVELGARLQVLEDETLEVRHRLLLTPQGVVEPEHLRDDPRAHAKRRVAAGRRRVPR